MPRRARAIAAGYCYHVLNRANHRAQIFHDAADYRGFVDIIAEACDRRPVPLLAACLMPNHIHLVLMPLEMDDLAVWMHWLCTTHAGRHRRRYSTTGRLWQGRFKASVIQQDHHLLTVLRYVERNALKAKLSERAEQWPWGSLRWRSSGASPVPLHPSPVPLPSYWVDYVNDPQTDAELEAIRTSVRRERPFGAADWVVSTAKELGVEYSLAPRGRPRKPKSRK